MKKLLSIVLCAVMLATAALLPANAVYDEDVENTLTDALLTIDYFAEPFNGVEARVLEIVCRDLYENGENGLYTPVYSEYDSEYVEYYIVPAQDFEAALDARMALSEKLLDVARTSYGYDFDAETYNVPNIGGYGGIMMPRKYIGYIDNGESYDVYYETIEYDFLSIAEEDIPEGMTEWDYIDSIMNTEDYTVTYKGNVYQSGPDGFYRVLDPVGGGRKYTVEINDGIVRILSYSNYTAEETPEQFETKPAVIRGDANADGTVDPFDYLLVKKIYFNTENYTPDQLALADVNGDGEVDAFDYLEVKTIYFKSN